MAARALAAAGGIFAGVMLGVWSLGGHYAASRWWLGAEGERETPGEIEKLAPVGLRAPPPWWDSARGHAFTGVAALPTIQPGIGPHEVAGSAGIRLPTAYPQTVEAA
jgi:hypothetical protein